MKRAYRHRVPSPLFLLLLLGALLSGCNGRIDSFEFVDRRDGEAHALELRDPERLPRDEEALLRGEPRRVDLGKPLEIGERDVGVYLRYEGNGGELRVGLGEEDLSWTAFTLPRLEGVELPVRYYAPLPPGRLASLEIDPGEGSLRIVELGLSPYRPGIELDSGGVQVSEGYDLLVRDSEIYLSAPEPLSPENEIFEIEIEEEWAGGEASEEQPAASIALLSGPPSGANGQEGGRIISDSSGGLSFEPRMRQKLLPGRRSYHLRPDSGETEVTTLAVSAGEGSRFRAFRTLRIGSEEPIPADMATILSYPRERWRRRDFELFRWSAYPEILLIDTASYEQQSRLFKRLAFFVEKEGFRGTLLSDGELAGRHGWNAHNYRPEGLAAFFNAAEQREFALSEDELLLRKLLLREGLLIASDTESPYEPGRGGILSISQESYPQLRELLLTHEAMHGIFYEEEGFRDRVRRLWEEELSEEEREFWRFFLSYMSYDPADDYLMRNEMQAYLLQYSPETIPGYFRFRIAERLRNGLPHQRSYIDDFYASHGETFRASAAALNEYLFQAHGFRGGDVLLLEAGPGSP
ncbi:MAG: hypothetical protein ACLFNP_08475 [Spirochaetaceae bacterium]